MMKHYNCVMQMHLWRRNQESGKKNRGFAHFVTIPPYILGCLKSTSKEHTVDHSIHGAHYKVTATASWLRSKLMRWNNDVGEWYTFVLRCSFPPESVTIYFSWTNVALLYNIMVRYYRVHQLYAYKNSHICVLNVFHIYQCICFIHIDQYCQSNMLWHACNICL